MRLAYREEIKNAVRKVVTNPSRDASQVIEQILTHIRSEDRDNVYALVNEELRRLHEGVLSRYGLRPSEFEEWRRAVEGAVNPIGR